MKLFILMTSVLVFNSVNAFADSALEQFKCTGRLNSELIYVEFAVASHGMNGLITHIATQDIKFTSKTPYFNGKIEGSIPAAMPELPGAKMGAVLENELWFSMNGGYNVRCPEENRNKALGCMTLRLPRDLSQNLDFDFKTGLATIKTDGNVPDLISFQGRILLNCALILDANLMKTPLGKGRH